MELLNTKVNDPNTALQLLKHYLLISKAYGCDSCLYALSREKILVLNKSKKYYISIEDFKRDFFLSDFYVYKNLNEIEIDQEFRKLRQ